MSKQLKQTLELAASAYSVDRYRSWEQVAKVLLKRGLTPHQAAAIMLSKWTRWAADSSNYSYGNATAKDLIKFMDNPRNNCSMTEINELVEETF